MTTTGRDILEKAELPIEAIGKDLWKHRSATMRCTTCMYYVPKIRQPGGSSSEVNTLTTLGRCRRHAPTLSGWPAVYAHDWCGDHKLDENKI